MGKPPARKGDMTRYLWLLLLQIGLLACVPSGSKPTEDTSAADSGESTQSALVIPTTSDSSSIDTSTSGTTGKDEPEGSTYSTQTSSGTTHDSISTSSSTAQSLPVCGNGQVEGDEACDEDSFLCTDCQWVPTCGTTWPRVSPELLTCLQCLDTLLGCCSQAEKCAKDDVPVGPQCLEKLQCLQESDWATCESEIGLEGWGLRVDLLTCAKNAGADVCLTQCKAEEIP